MDDIMMPREGSKWVANLSKHVHINSEGVKKAADLVIINKYVNPSENIEKMLDINDTTITMKKWTDHILNPRQADKDAIDWIFLVDTLNFSFWSLDEPKYKVKYAGKEWTGYWTICAAINRAIQKYDSTFLTLLTSCNRSARRLVEAIVEEFPCYRDHAIYNGRKVGLYKRAQILVADIWACFEGEGFGEFHDIDELTIFADYRIPQVLVWLNAMEYSKDLNIMLKQDKLLTNGEEMEVEIRACTIHTVELILKEVRCRGKKVNAVQVDHFLWKYRREHAEETAVVPYHKVRCIYY